MTVPCNDCDTPTHVKDHDEFALCETCTSMRSEIALVVLEQHDQAGAQFVGRERGTRDDRSPGRRRSSSAGATGS